MRTFVRMSREGAEPQPLLCAGSLFTAASLVLLHVGRRLPPKSQPSRLIPSLLTLGAMCVGDGAGADAGTGAGTGAGAAGIKFSPCV